MAMLQYLLQFKAIDGDFAIVCDVYGDFAIISSFDHLPLLSQVTWGLAAKKKNNNNNNNYFFLCVLNIHPPGQAEKMSFSLVSDVEDHSLGFGAHKINKNE